PIVCERPVQQKMIWSGVGRHQRVFGLASLPAPEHRQLTEQQQTRVAYSSPSLQPVESRLSAQRSNQTVTGERAHTIDALQQIAVREPGAAGMRNQARPARLKSRQPGQMFERLEASIGGRRVPAAEHET